MELRVLTHGEESKDESDDDFVCLTLSMQLPKERVIKRVPCKTMDSFFAEQASTARKDRTSVLLLSALLKETVDFNDINH